MMPHPYKKIIIALALGLLIAVSPTLLTLRVVSPK